MSTALVMLAAVLLDAVLGEPRRAHPLVAFGRFAGRIEASLHADRRAAGLGAWCLTVLPWVVLTMTADAILQRLAPAGRIVFDVAVLYLAIGQRSLAEHARAVVRALRQDDLAAARVAVSRMVSRDTGALDATRVAAATTESVLENGSDAVFGALFWFAVLGAPGAVLYRLANTLDAMWGYRTARYLRFGWASARIDDVLNLLPARLVAFSYALAGDFERALRCWHTQGSRWSSPNAGPVMAAGAGALGVELGGGAPYHGAWQERPLLGEGVPPDAASIERALVLVRNGIVLWLLVLMLFGIAMQVARHA